MVTKLFNGWLNGIWKKEDRDARIITAQSRSILLLFLLCILLSVGWMLSPSNLTIHIPPDIENGATLKANQIPNSAVYSFAYEIWQRVNYWPEEGVKDYPKNVHTYAAYLTPKFQRELLQEYDDLKSAGQVQRQRSAQGMVGAAYESINVKKLSNTTWEVDLKVRLLEYKNNQLVKDIDVLYPLKVIRWDISTRDNPYGLAIDGYVSPPTRLKTHI